MHSALTSTTLLEHLPTLKAFARTLSRSWDDVDDLVQHTMERALKNLSQFDPERARISTWLRTIMRNSVIDRFRTERSGQQALLLLANASAYISEETPESAVSRSQSYEALHQALARLKPNQREVLYLHYFKDLSDAQIAETTGTPLGTVKSSKRLGLQALKQAFA